jgi:hypothetical protein
MLRLNLFVYPRYNHYCFGDYYDDSYARIGIFPWYKCQTVHTWYDPLFVYDRWHFRQTDPHWAANQAKEFESRRSNRDLRPARTYSELKVQMTRLPANRRPARPLVESVKTYAASQRTPTKFERIDTAERQQIAAKATDVRSFRDQRSQWEAPPAQRATAVKPAPSTRTTTAAKPGAKPARGAKPPAVVPPHEVHVTQPERVTVPSTPRTPQPAESRFIPKVPPSHPAQEQAHMAPAPSPRTTTQNSQTRPSSTGSANKDRQR